MTRGYVTTRLGQVHFVRAGAGTPLVLLGPGWQSARAHPALIRLLAQHFQVVAIDPLGVGNSDPMPPGATIELFADSVIQALDALGFARAHVYGLHTGNKIAAALGAGWSSRIDRLILAGQSHSIIPDRDRRNAAIHAIMGRYFDQAADPGRAPMDPREQQRRGWARSFRRLTTLWWDDALQEDGASLERFAYIRDLALDEIQSMDGILTTYGANFAYDLEADLRRIAVPTLVLELTTPAEDRQLGRQGAAMQALIPGAALATIAFADTHPITLDHRAADIASVLLDFLGR